MYKKTGINYHDLLEKSARKKKSKYDVLTLRLYISYLSEYDLLTHKQIERLQNHLKTVRSRPDMKIPIDSEIIEVLDSVKPKNKIMYLIYLCSGLRKIEGKYLIENLDKLNIQKREGFVKIELNRFNKNKNAYFCYLPDFVYALLLKHQSELSIYSLEMEIKRKKLTPIKYTRKWFFSKCVELGVPESIADFYEGRAPVSVGERHYLGRQMLADKFYVENLVPFFRKKFYSLD